MARGTALNRPRKAGARVRYFPIFVDLDRQPVLVVGGGEQAAQKLRLLGKTTARIRLVADELNAELAQAVAEGKAAWLAPAFHPDQLDGCRLAYAATDDLAEAARVAFAARARGIPVNAIDRPQLCSFITPAIVDRDPIVVAIGSEGTAPVLVGRIRAMLEARLPQNLGRLAEYAQSLRRRIAAAFGDGRARRAFWERFFDGPASDAVIAGDGERAAVLVEEAIAGTAQRGSVALVGAGPGDPELLTLKAHRALQSADVLVIDRLVDPRIVDLARRDARRIHVGKTPYGSRAGGGPSTSQEAINAILVEEALAGHRVVRLKGGDPFVFGRAVEEILAVEAAGIPVEIIPGVTAALAAAANARLPITERGRRRALTILTGQTRDGPAAHDWRALAAGGQTLAVYMGVKAGPGIATNLIEAGLDPATPVTIVENASLAAEQTVTGRLDAVADLLRAARITGPAILFIGAAPLPVAASHPASIRMERAA
jgi:uroporphyrin-III C-methyltransferase / precorrin-2 dehydrogenase / sirohydrochlorin ferrochelatase